MPRGTACPISRHPSSTRSTARPWMWACWYAISQERTAAMTLDLETIAQIVMFFVAFYLIYLCLTQDVFCGVFCVKRHPGVLDRRPGNHPVAVCIFVPLRRGARRNPVQGADAPAHGKHGGPRSRQGLRHRLGHRSRGLLFV